MLIFDGSAQSIKSSVSRNSVGVGEHFQVNFEIQGSVSSFNPPNFDAFRMLSGPNKSSSMQWINGDFSSSVTYSYIMQATKEGVFTIGAASVETKGGKIESEPITIKVFQNGAKPQNQPSTGPPGNRNQSTTPQPGTEANDLSTNVFVKLFLNKKEAFVGEQIQATYKLYYDVNLVRAVPDINNYNGFYSEDLGIDPNKALNQEQINGRTYQVNTMKTVVLTPQKTGELEVPAMEIDAVVRLPETRRRRSIFDDFFGNFRDVRLDVKSNTQKINIKPLPSAGQPAGFKGAVGEFNLKVSSDRSEVNANDAVNITLTLEGKGNINLTSGPDVKFPTDFESYDPKVKENITTDGNGTKGFKSFEYVIIPRFAGEFTIDPIKFSYFDPASGSYKSVSTDPLTINVLKSDDATQSGNDGFAVRKPDDVQIIGKDIRYIKTADPELKRSEEKFFGTTLFYLFLVLPFAALAGAIFLIKFIQAQFSNTHMLKQKRAGSTAKKHLAKAKKLLNQKDEDFYNEISTALFGYLSHKLNLDNALLSRSNIEDALRSKSAPHPLIERLNKVLDECELVRFAPGIARSKTEMLSASAEIIEALENEI